MAVDRWQNTRAEYVAKDLTLNGLSPTDFHLIMPTAAEDITERYCAKTVTTIPVFSNARRLYYEGVQSMATKREIHLFTVRIPSGSQCGAKMPKLKF